MNVHATDGAREQIYVWSCNRRFYNVWGVDTIGGAGDNTPSNNRLN